MTIKKGVRERRMEKIRKLQANKPLPSVGERNVSHVHFPVIGDKRDQVTGHLPEQLGKSPLQSRDPEAEWNRKWQREWANYERGPGPGGGNVGEQPRITRTGVQIVASGLMFAAVWGLFHWDHAWARRGQEAVNSAMTRPLNTMALSAWYHDYFGSVPSLLPALRPEKLQEARKVTAVSKHYFTPLTGKLIAAFTPEQNGVLVEASPGSSVAALDTGRVTFAGHKENTGFTVVLRHADGLESVYGHLEQGKVQVNDWIKGGETLGTLAGSSDPSGGTLFFAVSRAGQPFNPTDVISFD